MPTHVTLSIVFAAFTNKSNSLGTRVVVHSAISQPRLFLYTLHIIAPLKTARIKSISSISHSLRYIDKKHVRNATYRNLSHVLNWGWVYNWFYHSSGRIGPFGGVVSSTPWLHQKFPYALISTRLHSLPISARTWWI